MDMMLKGLAQMLALVATKGQKRDQNGAAFTEYVVLLAVIVAVVVGLLWSLRDSLNTVIQDVMTKLGTAGTNPNP